ncbi:hypothetical protein BRADI_4g30075v3 [Brachypodium distachyon]|uniref:Uncharacterized protein n=1 Tax=Brachypodium distachyon TaxID=15368 RepID=A0A2K2CRA3_BRADI|nr:hypothetical protein BRADI_4g30075v3 [Brachypodium distachyon]
MRDSVFDRERESVCLRSACPRPCMQVSEAGLQQDQNLSATGSITTQAVRDALRKVFLIVLHCWIRHSRLRNSRRNIRCPGDEHRETKAPPPPYAARAPPAAAREETLRGGAGSSGYGGTARGDFFSSSLWLALFTLLIVCCGPLYICFSSLHPAA